MKLSIDENKWINYIINLENKLNNCFKVLKNVGKSSEKEFGSICLVESSLHILYDNSKVHKIVAKNTLDLFWPTLSAINTSAYLLA